MNFQKLNDTLKDAKANGEQQHKEAVKRIAAKGLIYRDGDGNIVCIPED